MITKNILEKFPEKDKPREQQIEILNKISSFLKSKKKYAICCLPTGSGKSHIAMTCALSTNEIDTEREESIDNHDVFKAGKCAPDSVIEEKFKGKFPYGSFILTVTKNLQDQYQQLFPESILIKGKNNYKCDVDNSVTVDSAPCLFSPNLKKQCFEASRCPYYNEKKKGLKKNNTVTNYKAYLSLADFLKRREILICDEASNLEDELVSYYSVTVSYAALQAEDIQFKKLITDDTVTAYQWLNDIYSQVKNSLSDLKHKFELLKAKKSNNFEGLMHRFGTKFSKLSCLMASLENVIENWHQCQYIIESKTAQEVTFVPLNIKPMAQNMFANADKVILMSATITNHQEFTKILGIEPSEYVYLESPSPFNPEKSPIFCSSKYSLSHQTMERALPRILDMVIEICDQHKGQKGLIHTHTHSITQSLRQKIKNNSRFLFREVGSSNEDIIQTHKNLKDVDTIIVSPSLDTGVSLDDDLGRFQIIIKAPFLPLGSKRIKKLFDKNPEYYMSKMLDTLVQMCGRCTRSNKDYSITYILDGTAVKCIKKYKDKLPKHFLDRFK